MPQFILEGKEIGLPAKLAWCTLCPPIPPVVTKVSRFGRMTRFDEMPALLWVPMDITSFAIELMKSGICSDFGYAYFREIVDQFRGKSQSL